MLPFDLTKALAAPDSVVYRNGEVPLELILPKHSGAIKIITTDKEGDVLMHYIDGRSELLQSYDLFLKEPEMFVNVDSRGQIDHHTPYKSYELAKEDCRNGNLVTHRLVEVTD